MGDIHQHFFSTNFIVRLGLVFPSTVNWGMTMENSCAPFNSISKYKINHVNPRCEGDNAFNSTLGDRGRLKPPPLVISRIVCGEIFSGAVVVAAYAANSVERIFRVLTSALYCARLIKEPSGTQAEATLKFNARVTLCC